MENFHFNSGEPIHTLILSPHIDDEVLGCFSFLGPHTLVIYFGVEDREYISAEGRKQELRQVQEYTGHKAVVLDNTVNSYHTPSLVTPIEQFINQTKPKTLLIPARSYNQDHRAVHDAAITASRVHDMNWLVPQVLVYEQEQTVLWPFEPVEMSLFKEVDIERKLTAYQLYKSQVREHRPPDLLRSIASIRGKQSGCMYAEGFYAKRYLI